MPLEGRAELERFCVNYGDHPVLGGEMRTLHKAEKKLAEVAEMPNEAF
jgi:hypothetical protein